jgi:hypothetical protein
MEKRERNSQGGGERGEGEKREERDRILDFLIPPSSPPSRDPLFSSSGAGRPASAARGRGRAIAPKMIAPTTT